MAENELISVIVPIYNVEQYLEQCIDSIAAQTYSNLEILLLNDGSTDASELICLEWRKKDERIVYVSKKNETLGPTRNLGIQMAKGKYIAFVDSDDWIENTFIEKLYMCVKEGDKDFARCDYYIVRGDKKYTFNNNEYYPFCERNIRKMIASTQAITIWTGLYKKELWLRNKIEMPQGPHQDLAILGLLFIYAEKIGRCRECLYYYRENREGNITRLTYGSVSMLPPLKNLIKEYKKRNLFTNYRDELLSICINRMSIALAQFIEGKNRIGRHQYYEEMQDFLNLEFEISQKYYDNKVIAVGSYNLQRVLSRLYLSENIEDLKFQHSSLISIMASPVEREATADGTFREKMVWADYNKKLVSDLKQNSIKYVLIDFVEECYDVLDFQDGKYITYSEALKETGINIENARIIRRGTQECYELWQSKCDQFIKLLKTNLRPENVFLVKFFLAEGFGEFEEEKKYESIEEVRKYNAILEEYYQYFIRNFEGIHVISLDSKYYFTDIGAKYGCYPWHLNNYAQYDIQWKINAFMD